MLKPTALKALLFAPFMLCNGALKSDIYFLHTSNGPITCTPKLRLHFPEMLMCFSRNPAITSLACLSSEVASIYEFSTEVTIT